MRSVAAVVVASTALLSAAGCSSDDDQTSSKTLTVFAAASLKPTFTALGTRFEAKHPGVKVKFNFAGSSDLLAQLQQGARADVFAPADSATMKKATDGGLTVGKPIVVASNTLQIAVPPNNPADVNSLADLTGPGVKVVVCAPQVPCGAAAQRVQRAAGVTLKPVSEESSVTGVMGKVVSGEADAGLAYRTDVKAADGKVKGIDFAQSSSAVNEYPLAALRTSTDADLADSFIGAVAGPQGQRALADAGFRVAFPVE